MASSTPSLVMIGGPNGAGKSTSAASLLRDTDLAVQRVRERVRLGGHDVPEETVRRRFERGLRNFAELHRPLADSWRVYDNSQLTGPRQIASGRGTSVEEVLDE